MVFTEPFVYVGWMVCWSNIGNMQNYLSKSAIFQSLNFLTKIQKTKVKNFREKNINHLFVWLLPLNICPCCTVFVFLQPRLPEVALERCWETCQLPGLQRSTKGNLIVYTVSILGREEWSTVEYTPLPYGVPGGEAQGNCWRQRGIFDRISRVKS